MSKFRRVSVTLPVDLLERIEKKAAEDGITRPQLLAALVDLGLRGAIWPNAKADGVLGPLATTAMLKKVEGTNINWAYDQLRGALWTHLRALLGSKSP